MWVDVEQACVGELNERDGDKTGEHKNINEEKREDNNILRFLK